MRQFRVPGNAPVQTSALPSNERRRLLFLVLGLGFVVAALGVGVFKSNQYEENEAAALGFADEEMQVSISLPEIDAARIEVLVEDSSAEERVLLESEGVDALLGNVRPLTGRHFDAMEPRTLDAGVAAEILADPTAHRAKPFLARGWVESLRTRRRGPTNDEEHIGRLILEDRSIAYFLVLEKPERLIEDDFVRVDGLFLKMYSDESRVNPGEWQEGPLLVGPRAVRSHADFEEVTMLDTLRMQSVQDDRLMTVGGAPPQITGLPFEATWHMMAYARDLDADAIDWEAAEELNKERLRYILEDGAQYRGRPFRIPISRLQGSRVRRADENPARIEFFTEGWIGNNSWKSVIFFKAPFENREIHYPDYVYGRGFFLKNWVYESNAMGMRVAPVFVLHDLEQLEPEKDVTLVFLGYAFGVTTLILIGVFFFLLVRDKRKSKSLQEDLVRRRRARRERDQSMGAATS